MKCIDKKTVNKLGVLIEEEMERCHELERKGIEICREDDYYVDLFTSIVAASCSFDGNLNKLNEFSKDLKKGAIPWKI